MPEPSSPLDNALSHLRELDERWRGIQNADVEAVHEGRVATRRIRAALPYVAGVAPGAVKEIRRIGRALGRVRELDVTAALLETFETRIDRAPRAIAIVRDTVRKRLKRERREMIKRLDCPPRTIARALVRGDDSAPAVSMSHDWQRDVRAGLSRQADEAAKATRRASAIFRPNRSHAARIAIKELRYTAELAAAMGCLDNPGVLDDLKKAQDALGELNDHRVVAKLLADVDMPRKAKAEAAILAAVIDFEIARLHQAYLRRRDRLSEVFAALHRGRRQVRQSKAADAHHEAHLPRHRPAADGHHSAVRPARVAG